jgi:hypothetical protein
MIGKRVAAVVLAIVSVAGLGCGKSKEAQAFDSIGNECRAFIAQGATLTQVDNQFNTATVIDGPCCPQSGSIEVPIQGTCPEQTATNPECSVFFAWPASDPSLCSQSAGGGCWFVCELRVMRSSYASTGMNSTVCDGRWSSKVQFGVGQCAF